MPKTANPKIAYFRCFVGMRERKYIRRRRLEQLEPRILLSGSPMDPEVTAATVQSLQAGLGEVSDVFRLVDGVDPFGVDMPAFSGPESLGELLNFGEEFDTKLADRLDSESFDSTISASELLDFINDLDDDASYTSGTVGESGYERFQLAGHSYSYDADSERLR